MENAGKMMWNDMVNANCIRASVSASKAKFIQHLCGGYRIYYQLSKGGQAPRQRQINYCLVAIIQQITPRV
jgi:hypothetical protein